MGVRKSGTLVVVVLKARNLSNLSMYKQSPYCLVRLGGGGKRTKTDPKGGQHPVWDEELHFDINPESNQLVKPTEPYILRVGCFVTGKKVDDRLGDGEVVIDECLRLGEFDDWVPLSLDGVNRGEVYLEMTYFPLTQPLARRPSKLSPADRLWRPPQPSSPSSSPRSSPAGLALGTTPNPTGSPLPMKSHLPPLHNNPVLHPNLGIPYMTTPKSATSFVSSETAPPDKKPDATVTSIPSLLRPGNQKYAGSQGGWNGSNNVPPPSPIEDSDSRLRNRPVPPIPSTSTKTHP